MEKKHALIIGGGISGLFAALILAKNGYKTQVIEKEVFVGGVCRSYEVDGYRVDTGPHVITHLQGGVLGQLMNKYFDLIPNFVDHGEYYIRRKDSTLNRIPLDLIEFLSTDIIPKKDKPKIAIALTEGLTKMLIDPTKLNIPLHEYIQKYKLSKQTTKLVDTLAYFLAGTSMKECPAWRFFTGSGYWSDDAPTKLREHISKRANHIRKAFLHDRFPDQGYPVGGIGSIVDAVLYSLRRLNVDIHTQERAVRINTEEGRVVSVETERTEYKPDIVIYAAELRLLPTLMDELPEEYAGIISTLKETRTITIWIGFDDKKDYFAYKGSEICYESNTPFWAMCISNFDHTLAPKGRKLVGFASVLKTKSERRYQKMLMDEIFSIFPAIETNMDMIHIQFLRPEKAALRVNSLFPGTETGTENLFCVGTDVDYRSMGVTRAAYSVVELAQLLGVWQ